MDELTNALARSGFLPHGYCFAWSPTLLWTMVGSDTSIALAYFSIPLVIATYMRRRPAVNLGGLGTLFSAFIFACGITHLLDVWTIWRPDYGWHAAAKAVTAVVSVLTAITAWRMLPRALAIPSVDELRGALRALQSEVDRRASAEDRLFEIEQSLAATLATIEAGFITTDVAGRVTRINAVAERLTGWSSAEALGESIWRVFERAGRDAEVLARNPVDVLQDSGLTAAIPRSVVCIARDGTETPVEVHAELTRRDDGSVRGMTLIFRDETRLSSAEAEVRRLAAVVASSRDAVIVKDLSGRITDWNAAAERMFGYTVAEAVGQPVQMLIPHERETEELRILSDLARGETIPPQRTVRIAKDGRRIDVSIQVSPIRDGAGRIVGGAKVARDLTHQRQIESALRHSEARLRFALESAAIGDWVLEPDTGRIHRSRRYDLCFGLATSPPQWSRERMLDSVHPADRAKVAASLDAALQAAAPWHGEFRVFWPDGSLHWLRMDAQLAPDEPAGARLVGIVADVTEMRMAEQARQHAQWLEAENQRVQESNRLKSQFLANMSHELRTPLNSVIGFADLLRSGVVDTQSPKHQEYLGHIARSGRHLLEVINDVLDLSKIEAGKLEFVAEVVDLPRLIDEVIAAVGPQAAARRLEIVSVLAPEVDRVELDPARLKQVLFNYLSNAIKFTEPGGRIEVRTLGEGPSQWRLDVEDNGIGIAAEDLPRLFVEFQQLDGSLSKRHQGTGLGLALTRRLVEAQGGRVGVYSEPGRGSRFYAVLPRRADGATEAAPAELPHPPRLLVAARDHAFRDALARRVASAGLTTDVAATAAEVVHLARVRRYSALTLDLALPDAPGLAALADVRAGTASAQAEVKGLGVTTPRGESVAFAVTNVIGKPLQAGELNLAFTTVRGAFDAGAVVLVVDDDPMARDLMQGALAAIGLPSVAAEGGAIALERLAELRPAAMVLDLMMPEVDGFQVLHALRRDPAWRGLPVFIWTAMTLTAEESDELARSAEAILDKGGDGAIEALQEALLRWAQVSAAVPGSGTTL